MRKTRQKLIFAIVLLAVALPFSGTSIQGAPQYSKVFKEVYPDYQAQVSNCAICHPASKKTDLNDYGRAVAEALGARNVKDQNAIEAALKKAEGKLPKKP